MSSSGPSILDALNDAASAPLVVDPNHAGNEPAVRSSRGRKPALMYSVVVPVMNEQDNVRPLVQRVTAVLEKVGQPFEIVFVDDGSRDATPALIRAMSAEDARVRGVRLSRNFGQECAVQAGYKAARGEWILQMDGDLQNPPEDIPKLLVLQDKGYDIVFGIRTGRKDPFFRKMASETMRWIMRRMLDIELPDDISTFRLMRATTAKLLADLPERQKFLSALACWVGARYTTVDVGHAARAAGKTKYNFTKLLNHTFDLVVGFSSKPLRYVGYVGLMFAALGFLLAARAIAYQLFLGTSVTGWASLFSIVSVLGGVQLVALSLIGEYIARIYFQAQSRPFFFVAEFIEHGVVPSRNNPIASHPPVAADPLVPTPALVGANAFAPVEESAAEESVA